MTANFQQVMESNNNNNKKRKKEEKTKKKNKECIANIFNTIVKRNNFSFRIYKQSKQQCKMQINNILGIQQKQKMGKCKTMQREDRPKKKSIELNEKKERDCHLCAMCEYDEMIFMR